METVLQWGKETFTNLDRKTIAVGGAVGLIVAGGIIKHFRNRKTISRPLLTANYEKDVVYVYGISRTSKMCGVLQLSPFVLKLETFLRMTNIKYKYVTTMQPSSKKQIPWIELNGKPYADSTFIIKTLSNYFKVDTEKHLTAEQRGVSVAFQEMMDNYFVWTYVHYRYVTEINTFLEMFVKGIFNNQPPFPMNVLPRFMISSLIRRAVDKKLYAHGIGRHTAEEIAQIGVEEIHAISNVLGTKQFLMGEEPSMVDCWMFGHLTQVLYCPINFPYKPLLYGECQNVKEYVDRMRNKFWPDWDELFQK